MNNSTSNSSTGSATTSSCSSNGNENNMNTSTTTTAAAAATAAKRTTTIKSSSSPLTGTAAGYMATQNGLTHLLQDLLSTVKGMRKVQMEQTKRIEELEQQVKQQQQDLIQQSILLSGGGFAEADDDDDAAFAKTIGTDSSMNTTTANSTRSNITREEFAKLRRELVGMIGAAMAHQEEELEAMLVEKIGKQCQDLV